MTARQVSLIRAVVKYMAQTSLPFSAGYMSECLKNHAVVSKHLFDLFEAKFCPEHHSAAKAGEIQQLINAELNKVENLAEDQILKAAFSVVNAMLRTNIIKL